MQDLLDFIKKIASMELCSDSGVEDECFLDSHPCCGAHENGQGIRNEVKEARKLIEKYTVIPPPDGN